MSSIAAQLKELRKVIRPPFKIIYVNEIVLEKDWKPNTIYIQICI